jgi:hypothetical protein
MVLAIMICSTLAYGCAPTKELVLRALELLVGRCRTMARCGIDPPARVDRPFRLPVPEYPTMLRFHSPLIEPDLWERQGAIPGATRPYPSAGEG